ncbi:hypothetical protein [Salmonella enterica]|uniref:hypothetical protein n=1 Tax=Salmonella enterica TaxID=28901 RepID=UPI0015922667|nr:hypothetical protein [Salmonella enterica]EIV6435618.1 hypothetical protein [Salmonella enterica]EJA7750563.1 hypothetical protein [Salmonella enterica]EJE4513884.1 hypothetical protein [Salmonella enterica]EKE8113082.1 hypothetical protein [Salmonella enterica]EKM4851457.1 hypothetical protein [Salmonella enterica]
MPAHAVPIDVKEKGVMWLLPPYSWSVRHIAQKLALSSSVVAKWRQVAPAQLEPDFYTGLRGHPVFKAIVCGLPILHDVK